MDNRVHDDSDNKTKDADTMTMERRSGILEEEESSESLPTSGEEDETVMPPSLQTFLSHVGVLSSTTTTASSPGGDAPKTAMPSHSWRDIIFESTFDLTEDRLKYVFDMLVSDTTGRISYESLRRGLDMQSSAAHGGPSPNTTSGANASSAASAAATHTSPLHHHHPHLHLTQASFDRLVELLDVDKSQDITFEEFSHALRFLMLRALFPPPESQSPEQESNRAEATMEVLDYDAQHLERNIVVPDDKINVSKKQTTKNSSEDTATATRAFYRSASSYTSTVGQVSTTDFYFQNRPDWVQTRWINVSGAKSSVTLKRLAVRYMLHPLALEDALSPERHRPKAEVYSNHYFIMIPIFVVEPPTHPDDLLETELMIRPKSILGYLFSKLRACLGWKRTQNRRTSALGLPNDNEDDDEEEDDVKTTPPPRIGRIRVQMTSIFVNVPRNDTIITYNDELYHPPGYRASVEKTSMNSYGNDPNSSKSLPTEETAAVARPHQASSPSPEDQHCWTRIYEQLGKPHSKLRQYDGQYLTYALLDQAVDLLEPILHAMRHEILRQDKILQATNYQSTEALHRIHHLRIELEKVARKLKPFLRLLVHVIEDDAISPGPTVYVRDVLDNLECHEEEVRKMIGDCEAIDAQADKFQSRQMDRTLYTLTVLSAVFLPVQFLAGVYGMNFVYMPELDEEWGYKMFWGVSSSVVFVLVVVLNFGRI